MKINRGVIISGVVAITVLLVIFYLLYGQEDTQLVGDYYYHQEYGLVIRNKEGADLGRVFQMDEVGWNEQYILVKQDSKYYLIDRTRDYFYLNADEIVLVECR